MFIDDDSSTLKSLLARDFIDRLDVALWIYDIDKKQVLWANEAALGVWKASSLESLRARDLSRDMSPAVDQRLTQYKEDFERSGTTFSELWTLYPSGTPITLRVKYRGFRLPDGRMAMLCEANEEKLATPEALRSSEALLHTTVMISLIATDGKLLYCNPAARTRFGSSSIDALERFNEPADRDRLFESIAKHRMCQMTLQINTIQGLRWHDLHAFSCHDAATGERAILISEFDVTAMHDTQEALEKSRNEALEATRLKSEFLANMSHEIRTPLNGVLGMAQLLEQTELTELQRRYTETVRISGASLLSIIDDVLDISRIEAGLVEVEENPFDVAEVIRQTIETISGVVISKGLEVVTNVNLEPPGLYVGDERRLKQVLINLAGNAVKFTDRGHVSLTVQPSSFGRLRFEVSDTGVGIPYDQQATIFERFRQADGSNIRKHGGTGLGLAICSSLVELMGGQIGVSSEPGRGSCFWIELPLFAQGSEPDPQQLARNQITDEADAEAVLDKRILLVEDNSVNQFLVMEALRPRGYLVHMAENGREALDILEDTSFDLIIMDLQMPVMSGEEAIAAIRSSGESYAEIPILVFTANAMSGAEEECRELGANGYLTKPVDIHRLINEVKAQI